METLQANELFAGLLLVLVTIFLIKQLLPASSNKRRTASPSLPRPRGFPIIGNLHQLGTLPHKNLAALSTRLGAPLNAAPPRLRAGARHLHRRRATRRVPAQRPGHVRAPGAVRGHPDQLRPAGHRVLAPGRHVLAHRAPRVAVGAPRRAALVAAVTDLPSAGSPVNLSGMIMATSNMIVRRVAFGDDGEGSIEAGAVLEETQYLLGAFFVADYIPRLGCLDALRGLRSRLERNFRELDAFYERVIDEHMKKRDASKEEDLVDVLLRLHGDPTHGSTFSSRSQLKGVLTDMFIAGTDTAAATVEWTMTELLRNPDILAKAQHEVRSVVAGSSKGNMVRETDLPGLKYLKQVIREAMRLHPPVPLLVPRETIQPCTVYDCEVPAKTRVIVNAKAIGLDPAAWGADAELFLPERHEEIADLSDHKPWHDSFALVPFGVGRRSCPGVHFATAVVELLLANLLSCFDWRAPTGGEVDLEEEIGLTVHRKNPLVLVAHRR